MMRPRGNPRPPSAMSRDKLPVETPSMGICLSAPSGMIEPSPNCFSIAASVLRSSVLDSRMPVGLLPALAAAFLDDLSDLSDLLSDFAIRVLVVGLLGVVPLDALVFVAVLLAAGLLVMG